MHACAVRRQCNVHRGKLPAVQQRAELRDLRRWLLQLPELWRASHLRQLVRRCCWLDWSIRGIAMPVDLHASSCDSDSLMQLQLPATELRAWRLHQQHRLHAVPPGLHAEQGAVSIACHAGRDNASHPHPQLCCGYAAQLICSRFAVAADAHSSSMSALAGRHRAVRQWEPADRPILAQRG